MSRGPALRNPIVVLVLLLLSFVAISKTLSIPLLWRRAFHSSIISRRPYQAPMVSCEYGHNIEGDYFVFLHQGYSLENHAKTVENEVNLTSKIHRIYPGTPRHGLYYYAQDIDKPALEGIRADIVVDMIECNRELEIDNLEMEDMVISEDLDL